MSDASTVEGVEQCIALTGDGERCSRPAGPDGFCFQHDENTRTIEEADDVEADTVEEALEERDEMNSDDAEGGQTAGGDQEVSEDISEAIDGNDDLTEIREAVQATASGLIGRPLDGVVSISKTDNEGWRVVVDCLERKSIPDTQDILGQYEIEFSEEGSVVGYRRQHRYRRGDTAVEDGMEMIDRS